MKFTAWTIPAAEAARHIRSASAAVFDRGFSQKTCLPAAAALIAMGAWRKFGVAMLTTSIVVAAVGARYLLAGRYVQEAKTMLHMGIGMVAILAPLQLFIGDQHGLNTAKYQPAKVAAMEAHWDSSKPAPLILFAWPSDKEETNHFEIAIPNLASLIITHQMDGLFKGLKDFAPEDRPPVKPVRGAS